MNEKLYTVKEAAEIINFKPQSVRNAIYDGRIKTVKILGAIRITQSELDRLIKERE